MKRFISIIVTGVSLMLIPVSFSFAYPDFLRDPDALSLTLENTIQNERGGSTKRAVVKNTASGIDVLWQSLSREKTGNEPWPAYKVKTVKGFFHTDTIADADSCFLPILWSPGNKTLERNSLMWFPQNLLATLKNKKTVAFDAGIFFSDLALLESNSEIDITLQSLRNMTGIGSSPPPAAAPKKQIRDLSSFLTQATTFALQSQKETDILLNGNKETIPVMVVGNSFIELTILAIPSNPLIIETKFNTSKIPDGIGSHWNYLKNWGSFKIIEIGAKE
ncbi:hypothetical protein K1X76_07835 [bacterium]|nr:hypothetical protein [bacterium]